MIDFQIQRLLQERRLEEYAATDDELVGFLRKAARGIGDAQAKISEEGAFLRGYEAAFLAATAAILNAGYRLRVSAEGTTTTLCWCSGPPPPCRGRGPSPQRYRRPF
jgi:hypothetical protein